MSVPDQVDKMRAYCEANGYAVGSVYEERDVSGRRPLEKRPGLRQAVADVESGRSQVIVTAYFDRLVRSVVVRSEVVNRVEKTGGAVMTVDMGRTSNATAGEKLSGTLLAAIAEYVADQAGEKTHVTKQRNIDKGIPPFPKVTPAYQRREDGTLEQHELNAPHVREAIEMRLADRPASYTALARFLSDRLVEVDEDGNTTPLTITPGGVEQMFRSKLMVGELHFGTFTPNLRAIEKPIMSHSEYRRLESKRATRGRYAKSERLLARQGVLVCETCDARMTVDTAYRGRGDNRKPYTYYRCGNRLCSAPALVNADVAETYVWEKAKGFAADLEGSATMAEDVEAARVRRAAAEEALANAIRTLAGVAGEPATKEVLDELQAARDEAVDEHERLTALTTPDVTLRAGGDVSFEGKRDLIRAVVARAVVSPGRGADRIDVQGRGTTLAE
jgi:DNA invertase Pin-like site-specific DNA recombinase